MIDQQATNEAPHMVWVEVTDARGRTRLVAKWIQTPATPEHIAAPHAA